MAQRFSLTRSRLAPAALALASMGVGVVLIAPVPPTTITSNGERLPFIEEAADTLVDPDLQLDDPQAESSSVPSSPADGASLPTTNPGSDSQTPSAITETTNAPGTTDSVGSSPPETGQPTSLTATGPSSTESSTTATPSTATPSTATPSTATPNPTSTTIAQSTPTPSASAGPAAQCPSGECIPNTSLPGWELIFSDDFTDDIPEGQFPAATNGKWWAYPSNWTDTSGNGAYEPNIISTSDGLMDINLRTEGGRHRVAAPVPNINGPSASRDQLYGRYAVRFKADPVAGYKTAWLLWPESNVWPRDGEIDFPEGDLDGAIHAFMHRQDASAGGDQDAFSTSERYTDWHTAITEWSPTEVRFILDGVVVGTSTGRIPNTPMHWVLQTETQLSGGPPSDSATGHVLVDWVSVWRYAAN